MGFLEILNGVQNGPREKTQAGKGGMSPLTMAMLALLAYKAYQKMSASQPRLAPSDSGEDGGLGNLGGLGGMLNGGAAGSVLRGGLGELLRQFQQSGHADVAASWVATGPNQEISPQELGKALGKETVNSLAEQAGLSKTELLAGLSHQLPSIVDQLTPEGRVPTAGELAKLV